MTMDYHFVGIGGIGMSGLARIVLRRGLGVSGSDAALSAVTEELSRLGAHITLGHDAEKMGHPRHVVVSTAIRENNPEMVRARALQIPVLHRSELLAQLMEETLPLLVTGTHGKTTTSALLAHVLSAAGWSPSYAVGGIVQSLQSNGDQGSSSYFVAEADESDGSFLRYTPFGAIVTNIDDDHLDHWQTVDALTRGYEQFARSARSPQHLLWCGDDERLAALHLPGKSYGFAPHHDFVIKRFIQDGWKSICTFSIKGEEVEGIEIPLIGAHNMLNTLAVWGLAHELGLSEEEIRSALRTFAGVGRRVEPKGEVRGISVFDDYAHHPTEIAATVGALKRAHPTRRLVVAFQPHRYTRTRDCLQGYPPSFAEADHLLLTDIYAASEEPIAGITGELVYEQVRLGPCPSVSYTPRHCLTGTLAALIRPGDVVVTMGAGDIARVGKELVSYLAEEKSEVAH
jgi:UDP-N-acetylmuramate--alanine ligase